MKGVVTMIPSVVFTTGIGKVLVRYRAEWSCKRDSLGRRSGRSVRGSVHGVVVARYNKDAVMARDAWIDPQEFPPTMKRSEAVKAYVDARTPAQA